MNLRTLLFLLTTLGLFNACGVDVTQLSHKAFKELHRYNVGQRNYQFYDSLRQRPLNTEIWYPTNDTTGMNASKEYPFILPPTSKNAKIVVGKFPLILLSHGTGGNRFSQMWLATKLSAMGHIVVAVDHWGNTIDNKIPLNFVKIWDRPLDISFILDQILNHGLLSHNIDNAKIGIIGFSLGGFTSIALAGGQIDYGLLKKFSETKAGKIAFTLPELGNVSDLLSSEIINQGNSSYHNLADKRITAFVAMAPALGQGFNHSGQFKKIKNRVLIIAAQNDSRTPVITNAKHYNSLIENSIYIELAGKVGHYIFMNEAKGQLKRNAPIVFKDHKSVDRAAIHTTTYQNILAYLTKTFND